MESKTSRVSVRITATLKEKVEGQLERDGITMSDLLTSCLMDYVDMTPDTKQLVKNIKKS
jgi:antitoxin component of RelBE/YafQ-DinJ toxin-antitoxin module